MQTTNTELHTTVTNLAVVLIKLKESKAGRWHVRNCGDVTSVDKQVETPGGVNHQSDTASGWQVEQLYFESCPPDLHTQHVSGVRPRR